MIFDSNVFAGTYTATPIFDGWDGTGFTYSLPPGDFETHMPDVGPDVLTELHILPDGVTAPSKGKDTSHTVMVDFGGSGVNPYGLWCYYIAVGLRYPTLGKVLLAQFVQDPDPPDDLTEGALTILWGDSPNGTPGSSVSGSIPFGTGGEPQWLRLNVNNAYVAVAEFWETDPSVSGNTPLYVSPPLDFSADAALLDATPELQFSIYSLSLTDAAIQNGFFANWTVDSDPGDVASISVVADPTSIVADGVSQSLITATVTNAGTDAPMPGETVTITAADADDPSAVGSLGPVIDHGDGTYLCVYTSGPDAGTIDVTATDGPASDVCTIEQTVSAAGVLNIEAAILGVVRVARAAGFTG